MRPCVALCRHSKTGGVGRVEFGQTGYGSKWVILSEFKTGSGQSGCGFGRVDPYFSHDFFFIYLKKTSCIHHLENHVTNYMM